MLVLANSSAVWAAAGQAAGGHQNTPLPTSSPRQVAALWRRVFTVECLLQLAVAAAVVPSSLSAWGVATLPFALVLVLDLQAASPAAVAEGEPGETKVHCALVCLSNRLTIALACWCRTALCVPEKPCCRPAPIHRPQAWGECRPCSAAGSCCAACAGSWPSHLWGCCWAGAHWSLQRPAC